MLSSKNKRQNPKPLKHQELHQLLLEENSLLRRQKQLLYVSLLSIFTNYCLNQTVYLPFQYRIIAHFGARFLAPDFVYPYGDHALTNEQLCHLMDQNPNVMSSEERTKFTIFLQEFYHYLAGCSRSEKPNTHLWSYSTLFNELKIEQKRCFNRFEPFASSIAAQLPANGIDAFEAKMIMLGINGVMGGALQFLFSSMAATISKHIDAKRTKNISLPNKKELKQKINDLQIENEHYRKVVQRNTRLARAALGLTLLLLWSQYLNLQEESFPSAFALLLGIGAVAITNAIKDFSDSKNSYFINNKLIQLEKVWRSAIPDELSFSSDKIVGKYIETSFIVLNFDRYFQRSKKELSDNAIALLVQNILEHAFAIPLDLNIRKKHEIYIRANIEIDANRAQAIKETIIKALNEHEQAALLGKQLSLLCKTMDWQKESKYTSEKGHFHCHFNISCSSEEMEILEKLTENTSIKLIQNHNMISIIGNEIIPLEEFEKLFNKLKTESAARLENAPLADWMNNSNSIDHSSGANRRKTLSKVQKTAEQTPPSKTTKATVIKWEGGFTYDSSDPNCNVYPILNRNSNQVTEYSTFPLTKADFPNMPHYVFAAYYFLGTVGAKIAAADLNKNGFKRLYGNAFELKSTRYNNLRVFGVRKKSISPDHSATLFHCTHVGPHL